MERLTPAELAARYDGVYRKSERVEISPPRFERAMERGDDGEWGVGALSVDGDRVLFIREGETWLLPGGRLEPNETPERGAKRETEEETGIAVEITGLGAIAEQTFVHEETGESYEFYFATFLTEPTDSPPLNPISDDGRVDEVAWLSRVPENTFDRELVVRLVEAYI